MIEKFDIIGLIGGGTLGSIATMVVQKLLDRKKDSTDITASSLDIMEKMNLKLNSVIDDLQKISCYDDQCKDRINGENCVDCPKKEPAKPKRKK